MRPGLFLWAVLTVAFAFAIALVNFGVHLHWFAPEWHWIEVHTGTVNEAGPYYGFWSGFGSDIQEGAILGGVFTLYRAHNCHHAPCPRVASHTTKKGYRLCKKHVSMHEEELDLHDIHLSHQ